MKHNIFILLLLSLSLISCAEDEADTKSEPAVKTLSDNLASPAIFAELTIMDSQSIMSLQMLDGNSPLGLSPGDHLLSQTLSDNTSCVCGTDFIGNDFNGSFVFQQCEIRGSQGDPGVCNTLITTGSYEIINNQLILTPSSGTVMTFF